MALIKCIRLVTRVKKILATKLWLVNFVLAMYHDMGHNSCFKITKDLKEDKNNMKLPCIDRNAGIAKCFGDGAISNPQSK